jgi:release factor glutamine methyltransferase
VTPDVLIPRPETEHLVIALLDLARGRADASALEIADVGTGSGIIAVCAAKHLPTARVLAIDLSKAALAVACKNAETHGVADRLEFAEGDLFDGVPEGPRFDIIASNPPYVASSEFERLARDVRDHEPREALLAGERGTEVIERLVPQAAQRLKAGGHLLIEISPMIHDAVCAIVQAEPRLRLEPTVKDLARLPRVVQACKVDT